MKIRIGEAAKLELADAVSWYAEDSVRNAVRFLTAYESLIAAIVAAPERFPKIAREARRARFKRYPYSIIFVHDADGIWVGAVAHAKRRPGYWHDRLA